MVNRTRMLDTGGLLGVLSTAVVVIDERLTIVYANPATESLFGISERQVLGQPLAELMSPSDELVKLCERVLQTHVTIGLREFATRITGGKEQLMNCRAAPFDIEGGVVLELNDASVGMQIRHEADLAAQEKLSQRIVRQLAHEVKNPLGGMRGAAQLLERQLPDPQLKAYTKVIIDEADRLAALVDSILSAGGRPDPAECNLHEITEHVASLIEVEMGDGVSLVRDYDPSLPPIVTDKRQMIQAFLNLARNAMQALDGSGQLTFRTRANTHAVIGGNLYRLVLSAEVEDNGPGIAEELKATVFYPLVSGGDTGSGLGLTIAQRLATRNSGLIEFTSQPGRTVFKLRLPVGEPVSNGTRRP